MCKKIEFADTVAKITANEFGISLSDLKSSSKVLSHSLAKVAFCAIMSRHGFMTDWEISEYLNMITKTGLLSRNFKMHDQNMKKLQYRFCFRSVENQIKEIYK